jgi:diguanylate cyclase (GGDEF)-like protein
MFKYSFNSDQTKDSEVISITKDFYEGDIEKTAKALDLPISVVNKLLHSSDNYHLRDDISKKVHKIFRNKIFYLDQLTGVENKKGLLRTFYELKKTNQKFNLYYMDINKFKFINDTYGHDNGDNVIIECVERIKEYANNNNGFAYRLSGDEFAMITTSEKSEEDVINEVKASIQKPISLTIDKEAIKIKPSISIGKANIIKDEDVKLKELLKSADKNMYKDKSKK